MCILKNTLTINLQLVLNTRLVHTGCINVPLLTTQSNTLPAFPLAATLIALKTLQNMTNTLLDSMVIISHKNPLGIQVISPNSSKSQ